MVLNCLWKYLRKTKINNIMLALYINIIVIVRRYFGKCSVQFEFELEREMRKWPFY